MWIWRTELDRRDSDSELQFSHSVARSAPGNPVTRYASSVSRQFRTVTDK